MTALARRHDGLAEGSGALGPSDAPADRSRLSCPSAAGDAPDLGTADVTLILDVLAGFRAWLGGAGLTSPGSVAGTESGDVLLAEVNRLGGRWAALVQARRPIPIASIQAVDRERIVIALQVLREEIASMDLFVGMLAHSGQTGVDSVSGQVSNLIGRLTPGPTLSSAPVPSVPRDEDG